MTKFLVLIISVAAVTLSYDTEIRASLLNFVGIVKTVVDDVADSLCNEGDQCRRNDTLPIPFIDDMDTNPIDDPPMFNNPEYKKNEPYNLFEDSPADTLDNDNSKAPTHISPPRAIPAPPTIPDNKKIPWSDFQRRFRK